MFWAFFTREGILMYKYIFAAATAASMIAMAPAAQAAHVVQIGNSAGDLENVLLNVDLDPNDNRTRGTLNQSGARIVFNLDPTEVLVSNPRGQAEIDAADGAFTSLTFAPEDGSFLFNTVSFNVDAISDGSLRVSGTTVGGSSATSVFTLADLAIGGAGENRFSFTTNDGSLLSSITLTAIGTSFSSVEQIRLGVSAVPEPGTWALMLFGFGAVGYSMRRRKVGYKIMQAV
jgi:hypothetical protein